MRSDQRCRYCIARKLTGHREALWPCAPVQAVSEFPQVSLKWYIAIHIVILQTHKNIYYMLLQMAFLYKCSFPILIYCLEKDFSTKLL